MDPTRASNKIPSPPVTIESVSADDKGYRLDPPIRLPAHTSSVQISYAAVSLSDPEAIHFATSCEKPITTGTNPGRPTP